MTTVQGKVCIVTGGGSGIGTSLCRVAAAAGAEAIVVVDMNQASAQAVADSLSCKSLALTANVSIEMDIRRVINTAFATFGTVDVFFSNAGIPSNGGFEVPNDEWDRIWKVNSLSHVWVARHLFPRWIEAGCGGSLVITASAAGLLTQVGSLPYSVTKHAAVSIAEWMAITYKDKGINVHALCPQAVNTGMIPEGSGGAAAGGDGVLPPDQVAEDVLAAMKEGRFLILPHKEVQTYWQRKVTDYDRWIKGMGRLHQAFGKMMLGLPGSSAAKL